VLRGEPLAPGDSAIESPADPEVAIGAWCEAGRCDALPGGRITIRQADPDGRLRGTVEARLQDGMMLRGSFDAEWRPRRMFCG
jgi:hypothetical protein